MHGREVLEFFRGEHALERFHQRGERHGELDVVGEPAEVLEGVGNGLEEVGFALVEAAETVCAEGLHDADVDVGVVVLHECGAIDGDECGEAVEVVIEKLLAQCGRQIGLSVVEKGSDVVLKRAFAASLVVEEEAAGRRGA